jgi:hypothetical protein
MDIEVLANNITKLLEDFDTYEFRDQYDKFEDGVNDTIVSLMKDPQSVKNYLENIKKEGTEEQISKASKYLGEIDQSRAEVFDKKNITFSLVNSKSLKINEYPHRSAGDAAVVYSFSKKSIEDSDKTFKAIITNDIQKKLGLSEEELFDLAGKNTQQMHPEMIKRLGNVLFGDDYSKTDDMQDPSMSMIVVSNENSFKGASAILYPGVEDKVKDMIGGDFYILPSSIHEVLAVKKDGADLSALKEMVYSINRTEVEPKDRLSDHVFEIKDGKLVIAAEAAKEQKKDKESIISKLHENEKKASKESKQYEAPQKNKKRDTSLE